jgi:hypothetical protein
MIHYIYGTFNDDASSSGHVSSDGKMLNEMNGNDMQQNDQCIT